MITIILLSIGGAVLAAVIGTFWYSNATPMGKLHMKYLGFDKLSEDEKNKMMEEAKPKMPKMYAGQLALSFLTSFFTVFVVIVSIRGGVPLSTAIFFPIFAWLCFTVPAIGSSILWGTCDPKIAWKKFSSDTLSILVTILIIALVAGLIA